MYLKSLITTVLGVLGVVLTVGVHGQNVDSTTLTHLQEVVITHTRLQNYATGHFIQNVDTVTSRYAVVTNAAELFRKFGYGHIRSYGVGGVTTPSFRGTGSAHTAVLWNGINLYSPLNGTSDLSLLPVIFIDDVQLQSGGSASIYGSGAIGGTIQFNNKAVFKQGFNVSLTENVGSFKTFFHGLSATWSKNRWISSTKIFQTSAENNFPFDNNNFNPPQRQRRAHNAVEQHGILQQNYFQLNKNNLLSLRSWYQNNHYEVPQPLSAGRDGTATQRDEFYRSMIGWNHNYNNGHLFIQSAHVYHRIDYKDPLTKLNSPSSFNSFINTFENSLAVAKDLEWTSGANYTFESSKAVELLNGGPGRHRVALYTAFKYEPGKWTNVLSVRQEFVNGKLMPFAPSLGIDYRLHPNVSLFGSVSRNYRIGTFNDLYWSDASSKGNPDLAMETSWSEEIGAKLLFNHFRGQLAVFNNEVNDMIYWVQDSGKWTPKNVKKAWTRGLESTGTLSGSFGKVLIAITARYSYTLATTVEVYDTRRVNEIGKQLIFTPRHESGATIQATWKSWNLSFTNNYTGLQYTDDSNITSNALRAYNIANIWMSKDIKIKKVSLLAMIELNNLFDKQASARPGYPLPGRNFKLGINIRFNKPTKS